MPIPRILIIANKSFEAEPLMGVLADPAGRPPSLTDIGTLQWPRYPQTSLTDMIPLPRAAFVYGSDRQCAVEIWCIQDLMNPFLSYSNTAEKARVLKSILEAGKAADFVLAVGTASGAGPETSYNGSVVVGSRVFVHNPYHENSASNWRDPKRMDQVVFSGLGERFVSQLETDGQFRQLASQRMVAVPRAPAASLELRADAKCTAVSEVNIVDRNDYGKFDERTVEIARQHGADAVGSLETTHGVIRLSSEAPFAFVSGITNRLGRFADEVTVQPDTAYAQNVAAAHNAGVAALWMLPELALFLATGVE